MPQSLSLAIVHLIFSTKGRTPLLHADIRGEPFPYLATVAGNLGCHCVRVGGCADHVHMAVQLSRTTTIADLVEGVKSSSSRWLKDKSSALHDFAWQRGYGAFSVSPKDLDALVAYIDNQDERHRTRTFQEEYRGLLKKYAINFDERYVWDG